MPACAIRSKGVGSWRAYIGPTVLRLPTRQPPPCRNSTIGDGPAPSGGSQRSSSSGRMPGIAAYGTPGKSRTSSAAGRTRGSGASCAGGRRDGGVTPPGPFPLPGSARRSAPRSFLAAMLPALSLLGLGPVVVPREELHVVLLRGGLHPREVGDERRLLGGALVGRRAHVLEEPLEAAGERAHHAGRLLDLVRVREAGRHVAEVAGVQELGHLGAVGVLEEQPHLALEHVEGLVCGVVRVRRDDVAGGDRWRVFPNGCW